MKFAPVFLLCAVVLSLTGCSLTDEEPASSQTESVAVTNETAPAANPESSAAPGSECDKLTGLAAEIVEEHPDACINFVMMLEQGMSPEQLDEYLQEAEREIANTDVEDVVQGVEDGLNQLG